MLQQGAGTQVTQIHCLFLSKIISPATAVTQGTAARRPDLVPGSAMGHLGTRHRISLDNEVFLPRKGEHSMGTFINTCKATWRGTAARGPHTPCREALAGAAMPNKPEKVTLHVAH